jgi:formylmethanofuran:tetrahydromethanopterin formyltransferase
MATTTTTTTTHRNQSDRVLVRIPLPAGILGVNISDPVPQFESNHHVWVLSVKANSSGTSKLETGDWVVSINECDVHGQVASFCLGILAATVKSTTRKMVVLRSRTPQRFIYQEENTVNTTNTTNNQAIAMATVDAPLTTTTTTTTTKNPPPL